MGRSKITCCMNCTERYIGCHGSCKTYLEEVDKNNAEKEAIKKSKPIRYNHEASVNRTYRSPHVYKRGSGHKTLGNSVSVN